MGLVEVVPDYKYTMIVLSWLIEKTPFSFVKNEGCHGSYGIPIIPKDQELLLDISVSLGLFGGASTFCPCVFGGVVSTFCSMGVGDPGSASQNVSILSCLTQASEMQEDFCRDIGKRNPWSFWLDLGTVMF